MKRFFCVFFFIFLSFTLLFSLFSCQNEEYGILKYQDKNFSAECSVNEKYKISIVKKDSTYSLIVREPKEIENITFEYNGNECYAISQDMKIPVEKENLKGIFALIGIFSLDENSIVSSGSKNEQNITFENEYGKYIISFNKKGYPEKAEITDDAYKYSVNIESISFEG